MVATPESLTNWLLSEEGQKDEIQRLRRWSARLSFGDGAIEPPSEDEFKPDWQRLILAASLLAESERNSRQETALMIAQAALVYGPTPIVRDAGAVILTQLSNSQAIQLATSRNIIEPDFDARLGLTEQLLVMRRAIENSIVLNSSTEIEANPFQSDLWEKLTKAGWTSATAPTAAGKTYIILNWLLGEIQLGRCNLAVFLVPTRALVSEIEKQLVELKAKFDIPELRTGSLPLSQFGDGAKPTILVFTQERLHLFMNGQDADTKIDVTIIDEAQKISDGSRGVILQDAVERILRTNSSGRFVFLSPHSSNPELLLENAPIGIRTETVDGGPPTVTQNLLFARQVRRKPTEWVLSLADDDESEIVGTFSLHDRPTGQKETKRLSYIALALGRNSTGTLVYANGPADAEKIAAQIYDGLEVIEGSEDTTVDEELKDLADFCRSSIHPKFQLVHLLKRGVGFHYGNMPSILRAEIERLFRNGKIRFLVCTSTLVEGVNLACRTIIVRGPKKGRGADKHMSPQDFWNLAGRAGRWGSDFHGNIVCVDPDQERLWPAGVPQKTAYEIYRETDAVLAETHTVTEYIESRAESSVTKIDNRIEPVAAYLMGQYSRVGTVRNTTAAKRIDPIDLEILDKALQNSLESVELPTSVLTAHPGTSALSMQSLLKSFRSEDIPIDYLLPPLPEDENAAQELKVVFERINDHLFPAFAGERTQWAAAFTTVDWMRGKRLGYMIQGAVTRAQNSSGEVNFAQIIRNTMKFVEEFARFKAPKYLSAYIDVLRFHYENEGVISDFPEDLPFDLYLEFGVNTTTLLSFIGLGLSRTSAIEINEFLAREDMTESEALAYLMTSEWETFDLPNIVKREIRGLVSNNSVAV